MGRPSNEEVMSQDPIVLELVADMVSGKLQPNVRPDAVSARYPHTLPREDQAIACMMHACRIAASRMGAVLVVSLAANSEFLGQFDECGDMSVDDIGKEATDIAIAYRKRFPPTDPAYWIMPTLNVERMPRFSYGRADSMVIDY